MYLRAIDIFSATIVSGEPVVKGIMARDSYLWCRFEGRSLIIQSAREDNYSAFEFLVIGVLAECDAAVAAEGHSQRHADLVFDGDLLYGSVVYKFEVAFRHDHCCKICTAAQLPAAFAVADALQQSQGLILVTNQFEVLAVIAGSPVILYEVLPQMQLPFVTMLEA